MSLPSAEERAEWSFDRRRERLVRTLRERGIEDERVLEAIGRVPRHRFVEPGLRHRAYNDEALPIGRDQTISQPFTVAYQTMLLGVTPRMKVLEVGTGSGYQAAVLCELGARVFSIERHADLLSRTRDLLRTLGYRITAKSGDGSNGWRAFAPYDGIIVTAGATAVPDALVDQLRAPEAETEDARGGRLVIPVGDRESQEMLRITRTGPEAVQRESFGDFRFVPLVSDGD
ncbi:protein-L-isoaspartate(D-aspartate) O-methyltransferase [Salisaeta longa]|uniref:protein-L-isoaspartate(D-aspartate) O-methyltransferase n=1 Tax=Salisaeta longa TaxID=503170 RepID=UPI0003B3A5FE|nr:protein-L-isoaspartate(D-aspartate) O-methyltransferase [Salisaeta longa]